MAIRIFPGKFESSNVSRDNANREIGRKRSMMIIIMVITITQIIIVTIIQVTVTVIVIVMIIIIVIVIVTVARGDSVMKGIGFPLFPHRALSLLSFLSLLVS